MSEKQTKSELVARAFWRRIYPYRNDFERELPAETPVQFRASMETAMMLLHRDELRDKALRLCYEIEKLPASEQATKVVCIASEIHKELSS